MFVIFFISIVCIFYRPFGLRIWVYSSIGAAFAIVFKVINFSDLYIIFSLIWDSGLTLLCLIILSFCLESLGFFDKLMLILLRISMAQNARLKSAKMTKKAQNGVIIVRTKLMLLMLFLSAAITGAILANDGAILIFTPLLVLVFTHLKKPNSALFIALLCAICFICDASSNALIISNLTNIITANFFHLNFFDFASNMALPNALVVLGIIMLFFIVFSRISPRFLLLNMPNNDLISNARFCAYCAILGAFIISFFVTEFFSLPLSIPSAFFSCIFLLILFLHNRLSAINALKNAPFGIIIFAFGLFVIVFALYKNELDLILQSLLTRYIGANSTSNSMLNIGNIFSVGIFSSIGASVFNNLPMVLIGNLALAEFGLDFEKKRSFNLCAFAWL